MHVYPPYRKGGQVVVHVLPESQKRTAVQRWAARLGAPVVERVDPRYEGDPLPLEISATVETDQYKVTVVLRVAAPGETGGGAP